ncbi:MAG: formyl transferase [Gammaproteobacteria bacterium]|nr:formyl transferase [Gammaproteobacteria bacterium]
MGKLRVMILCGQSPRHLYVANRLCRAADVVAIVHESSGERSVRKVMQKLRPDRLWNKVWRWIRDRRRYTGGGEGKFFFGAAAPALDRPELARFVPHINHPELLRLIDETSPDLIAVFGTSLLRGEILTKGRLGIVNLHGGLSPEYRGADCTFWALYNGEPEKVGCTLHYIDAGIDTGKLIAHVCPEIHGDEDSAEVYAEFIERVGNGERTGGTSQQSKGRLYQVKHRQLSHERVLEQKLASGFLRQHVLPRRITWFAEATQISASTETVHT